MHLYVKSKKQWMKHRQRGRRETPNKNKVRFIVESKFTYIVCMHILHVLVHVYMYVHQYVRCCKCFYVHMQLRNDQERGLKLWLGNHQKKRRQKVCYALFSPIHS